MERTLGFGMHCTDDHNYKSDQNIKESHNCYFHDATNDLQLKDDEVIQSKSVFLACPKCQIHVGAKLSVQHQHVEPSFEKITPNISKIKVVYENNCFLYETQPNTLVVLLEI